MLVKLPAAFELAEASSDGSERGGLGEHVWAMSATDTNWKTIKTCIHFDIDILCGYKWVVGIHTTKMR